MGKLGKRVSWINLKPNLTSAVPGKTGKKQADFFDEVSDRKKTKINTQNTSFGTDYRAHWIVLC